MICPICNTANMNHDGKSPCSQCGANLQVHCSLETVEKELLMSQQNQHENTMCCHNRWLLWQQSILFILLCVFMIFMGIRVNLFSRHIHSARTSTLSQVAEFQQLTQMNAIINQQLNLIVEQHAENKALRERLRQYVASTNKNVNTPIQSAG